MQRALLARAFPALALPLLALPARPQSLNIDVGLNLAFPTPASTYGAGADRPGFWNNVAATPPSPTSPPLQRLDGASVPVTIDCTGGTPLESTSNLAGASSDELALLADVSDPGPAPQLWLISGLADGPYDIYTYAMAPDNPTFLTDVSVFGSPDPTATVGGAWPGAHVEGVTYARHRVVVVNHTSVVIAVQRSTSPAAPPVNYASLAGFQIVQRAPIVSFCGGDGVDPNVSTPCPCANYGTVGHGCANSAQASGALLVATGSTTPDTLLLTCTGTPAKALCQFLQGDAYTDAPFGDGVRCVGGALVRLRSTSSVAGTCQFPDVGDPSVSQRGGVAPGSGWERFYQTYYRNAAAAYCPPENFNITNGVRVVW